MNKGLIPIFFLIILGAAVMMGLAGANHVETKAERHQRQGEAE